MIGFIIFIIGACLGSFANVCIYRIPRGKSIVFPPSSCPKCKKPIKWHDNIPVLSFFILRGKCRNCGKKISSRYPIVEFIMGLLAFLLYEKFSISAPFLIYFIFVLALVIVSFIDWDTYTIPDSIDIPGIPAGILAMTFIPGMFIGNSSIITRFFYSFGGAVLGVAVIGFFAIAGKLIWKKDAMGGGDIKLIAMLGAFLGWRSIFLSIFFGSILGTLISMVLILIKKKKWDDYVPFGPYLSLGAIIAVFLKGFYFLGFFIH
ncbi:MAG: prepilin peptidase [Candidatus Omnitrophica bacterium]|nr:prepilin peptidase [Candidatus Omnitrophota bacterium]